MTLAAVDDGLTDVEKIREHVLSNVKPLSENQAEAVDDAITRLVEKQIITQERTTVRLQ